MSQKELLSTLHKPSVTIAPTPISATATSPSDPPSDPPSNTSSSIPTINNGSRDEKNQPNINHNKHPTTDQEQKLIEAILNAEYSHSVPKLFLADNFMGKHFLEGTWTSIPWDPTCDQNSILTAEEKKNGEHKFVTAINVDYLCGRSFVENPFTEFSKELQTCFPTLQFMRIHHTTVTVDDPAQTVQDLQQMLIDLSKTVKVVWFINCNLFLWPLKFQGLRKGYNLFATEIFNQQAPQSTIFMDTRVLHHADEKKFDLYQLYKKPVPELFPNTIQQNLKPMIEDFVGRKLLIELHDETQNKHFYLRFHVMGDPVNDPTPSYPLVGGGAWGPTGSRGEDPPIPTYISGPTGGAPMFFSSSMSILDPNV
jgi:hypothetical protein